MKLKEVGFRAVYHQVVAFELNEKLKGLIKDCPDSAKASHAVFYGYIDPQNGLMLEVLGAGKQAPKYFYFKEPYEGSRISVKASEYDDVEFVYFPNLENRFYKKYVPRIEELKQYDVTENVEKSREFEFLDEFRESQYPDDLLVNFVKDGLKGEQCWVRLTDLGDHEFIGTLLNQPYQDYGVNKGDTIPFHIQKVGEDKLICVADFNESSEQITKEDLADGNILKQAIEKFNVADEEEEHNAALAAVLTILRSSNVILACDVLLNDQAKAIADKYENENKTLSDMTEEDADVFNNGIKMIPQVLENKSGNKAMPAFSSEDELGEDADNVSKLHIPFINAIDDMAMEIIDEIDGIIINPFTEPFFLDKELFGTIRQMAPLFDDEESVNCQESFGDEESGIAIRVGKMDVFNYALYHNDIDPIRGIEVINFSEDTMEGLSLRISSDYHFFKFYEAELPPIPAGKPIQLEDPQLVINGTELAKQTEMVQTIITIEIRKDNETLCGCRGQMKVLAYDQWQGSSSYKDLLPSFVMPNHPVIPMLMHDAAERLGKWKKPTALEGYQAHDPNRVRDLAAAAYAAIQKKNIVYAEPPASFSVVGQRIRTPETVMEQRLGTCMDMTLLYASLLEAIGLHPLLVLYRGHIFAGVWLKERSIDELKKSNITIDNIDELTMRINNGSDELTFIECTAMCADKVASFEDAEASAKHELLANSGEFDVAIDVALVRMVGVNPLPSRVKDGGEYHIDVKEKSEEDLTQAPKSLDISITEIQDAKPHKIQSKRELWESKLLDLSIRNMLLNLPHNASIEPIMSSHIDELEDALSDGHEFNILPAAEWITELAYTKTDKNGKESKPIHWLAEAVKDAGIFEITKWPVSADFDFNEKFRQEFRSHRLYSFNNEKQLDKDLTGIYRAAKLSQQENGVSSLYLAVGLLRWFVGPEAEYPCYAPLILVPIEIVRKSANQGYALHARDEEPHFNMTLLEMLKQNYNIEIPGLDPLPTDEHGTDIRKVFSIVRSALFKVKNWDVVESCVIGNFSFARFAMWNDIHTSGDMLDNNKIVRSLMKGHVDWEVNVSEDLENEKVYLPISVDATQLKAIKMAAHGTTFVLHGPPGTGKSQTITAMIANLMAQGKKVLFVAEKMAALDVVQRRLTSLGVGDFCLELHSDKANKKQVLSQLEKALAVRCPEQNKEYSDIFERNEAIRAEIDEYSKHLHKVQNCGKSLRELIALYETVREEKDFVRFNRDEVGQLTKDTIDSHQALIGKLIASGDVLSCNITNHPLKGIGVTSFGAELRNQLRRVIEEYMMAINEVRNSSSSVAHILGVSEPKNKDDLSRINTLVTFYKNQATSDSSLLSMREDDITSLYDYYDDKLYVEESESDLLQDWKSEFLRLNVNAFLEKYIAAEKKFFGKGNAISAVVAELQMYANRTIVATQIPTMLRRVIGYQKSKRELQKRFDSLTINNQKIATMYGTKRDYKSAYSASVEIKKKAEKFPGGIEAFLNIISNDNAIETFASFESSMSRFLDMENEFNDLLVRKERLTTDDWFNEEIVLCEYLLENQSSLKEWGIYNQARQNCVNAGIEAVVEHYEAGADSDSIMGSYKKGLYYALINNVISADDVLSEFSGASFNQTIEHFKRIDDELLKLTKKEIYYILASNIPNSWDSPAVGMELNLLRKAIGSNARGMSIRNLFERIPNVIQQLCPCMLMSPNSVAQYLSQSNDLFDVVIFDEASQLPTCKAIGALARAKDAVIVGDPKQMPPTSFFDGIGPEVDDLALDDLDSILDDVLALGVPSQHLQWHYRSTHESLIAFSNNSFYDNKMYTFPSANDRERHVTAVHVDGVYNKSTNVKEAEAVVAEIIRRYKDKELKNQSIGVVTFNVKQQTLIQDLLKKQYEINPEFDLWAHKGEDTLFVKNLENVQGDERDVILFSIGYGPDEKGSISMNFGPINKAGGGKRLNVAFSRSRVTMMIFASIHSSDIKVTETSPEGLVAFRDFLKFAEGTDIQTESSTKSKELLSKAGIMQNICKAIKKQGFEYETFVGHSDFHVDIAVIDLFEPDKYLMGILLDGDGYKKTKNTRDREVSQISVLKNLGWNLTRVWTIDWWDNRDRELKKIIDKLIQLKQESEKRYQEKKALENNSIEEQKQRAAEEERIRKELKTQSAEVIAEEESTPVVTVSEPETKQEVVQTVVQAKPDEKEEKPKDTTKPQKADTNNNEKTQQGDPFVDLVERLIAANGKIIDKRSNGGALWVAGGKELSDIMKEFRKFGVYFNFKTGGGRATAGKDAWWAKTDVELPNVNTKK